MAWMAWTLPTAIFFMVIAGLLMRAHNIPVVIGLLIAVGVVALGIAGALLYRDRPEQS